MSHITVLGLFNRIEEPAAMVMPLGEIPVSKEDMTLISVAPYPDGAVLYDEHHSPIWAVAIICGVIGFFVAVWLAGWTQWQINLNVGGKSTWSVPPVAITCYEFSLAGMVLGTFFGMLWYAELPDWNELAYDNDISRSKVGFLVRCRDEATAEMVEAIMKNNNVLRIKRGRDDY